MAGADAVVIVDGTRSGRAAGTVRRIGRDEFTAGRALSSHALGVREALGLAEALGRLPGRVEIIGIEAGDAREGDLSVPIRDALPLAVAAVRGAIEELARGVAPDP
jgi:hydrogenase maturation protease